MNACCRGAAAGRRQVLRVSRYFASRVATASRRSAQRPHRQAQCTPRMPQAAAESAGTCRQSRRAMRTTAASAGSADGDRHWRCRYVQRDLHRPSPQGCRWHVSGGRTWEDLIRDQHQPDESRRGSGCREARGHTKTGRVPDRAGRRPARAVTVRRGDRSTVHCRPARRSVNSNPSCRNDPLRPSNRDYWRCHQEATEAECASPRGLSYRAARAIASASASLSRNRSLPLLEPRIRSKT